MKPNGYGMEYASARATPELVGRKEILGIINKAIENKAKKTQVIYITAKGGMGKTRLLEEVVKRWGGGRGSKSKKKANLLIVSHLIDLYHTHTHSEEGLIAEIVEALDPDGKLFVRYAEKRSELTHMKFEKGETQPIQGLRREMIEAFLLELNDLGKKYTKIVIVFDTAEVLTYETDRVQKALGLADQQIGLARWLTQDFLNRIRNAVLLIAGRPELPQLSEELKKTSAKIIDYDLLGFSESETLEYFRVVAEAARTENPQSAKRVESIPEEARRVFHYQTRGEPFLLALLIDYLAIAREIPILLEQRDPETFREELRDLIIEAFQEEWRPLDRVVESLSWTPKGMGAELLAWVLHHREPTKDEVIAAQASIEALREPERRLSFVKIRAEDDLVFLQDEMYALLEKIHFDPSAINQKKKIYADILAFYEWMIRQTRWKIEEMEKEIQVVGEIAVDKLIQLENGNVNPEMVKIKRARARLQAYQVEQVYYSLRVDPYEGFRLYSQYAEESFQSHEINLWLLLRNELLRFAIMGRYIPAEGLTLDDIDADMGIRWIKVNLADTKYEVAEMQMAHFRKTCPDLLQHGSYADLHLKICETWILAYTGKDQLKARKLLIEILEQVKRLPAKNNLDKWRTDFLQASAMSMQGFLYHTKGDFKQAVEIYLQAVPIWRNMKFELEASNNLNNLAWAEAETGNFQTALAHCKDGLHLRRKLGRRYLIGLSLLTLGLIETRAGTPERARFHCEQALEIFREMEDARGIGIACNALAECLRLITDTDLLTREQAIEYLNTASTYAEEAVKIFHEQVMEPLRLAETYIEDGCVYRELVRHLSVDDPQRSAAVEKSRIAYEAATEVAERNGYEYRAIDALVNMAWLYYYVGDVRTAEDILRIRVRDRLEDEHLFTRTHGVGETLSSSSWNWVQLGKANILLGRIHFDQYRLADKMKNKIQAELNLRHAAHNWTLSMAYNSLYGKDFRDFMKGREEVYECLEYINMEELGWVVDSMNQTHREYHIGEEQRAFGQFLKERFGLVA